MDRTKLHETWWFRFAVVPAGLVITPPVLLSLGVGALLQRPYSRFVVVPWLAKLALRRGQLDRASKLAREALRLAEEEPADWNHGNAIHHGHLVLGGVALARGEVGVAKEHLLSAGDTPGSPQLNTGGPGLELARDLVRRGEKEVVVDYLESCRRFWKSDHEALDHWIYAVREGRFPDSDSKLWFGIRDLQREDTP